MRKKGERPSLGTEVTITGRKRPCVTSRVAKRASVSRIEPLRARACSMRVVCVCARAAICHLLQVVYTIPLVYFVFGVGVLPQSVLHCTRIKLDASKCLSYNAFIHIFTHTRTTVNYLIIPPWKFKENYFFSSVSLRLFILLSLSLCLVFFYLPRVTNSLLLSSPLSLIVSPLVSLKLSFSFCLIARMLGIRSSLTLI